MLGVKIFFPSFFDLRTKNIKGVEIVILFIYCCNLAKRSAAHVTSKLVWFLMKNDNKCVLKEERIKKKHNNGHLGKRVQY